VARLLDPQGRAQSLGQPREGQLPVAALRAFGVHAHPDNRAESFDDPRSLPRSERRRRGRVEPHLCPGVRPVGVLPSGSTARSETPVKLVERDPQRSVHAKLVAHRCLGSHGD